MVPIRYVCALKLSKLLDEEVRKVAGDAPQGVTEPVLHHDTLVGLLSDGLRYEFGNGLTVTISEEYRTNIRVLYISECRAVLLLL